MKSREFSRLTIEIYLAVHEVYEVFPALMRLENLLKRRQRSGVTRVNVEDIPIILHRLFGPPKRPSEEVTNLQIEVHLGVGVQRQVHALSIEGNQRLRIPGLNQHLFEILCDLDVPAMIHVSAACNPNFHTTGSHYLGADTTAFMQMLTSNLLTDFPDIKFIIPHGGGAVPYHWGRFRGLVQAMSDKPPLEELVLNNVHFDTCIYHQPGIDLLLDVIPAENILFASELLGAVRGIDPNSGHYFDDTKRYIDASAKASDAAKALIFADNAQRVFSRLEA